MLSRFFAPFLPYIAGAALAAFLGLSVVAWWGVRSVHTLKAENAALGAQLRAEKARVELLRQEIASDAEIDAIPDADLGGSVDPRWLLDPAAR